MNNLDFIRQKCVEANPEGGIMNKTYPGLQKRPIRLADCLLAIKEKVGGEAGIYQKWLDGSYQAKKSIVGFIFGDQMHCWNLRKDSLEEQDEDTITFIADLLK